MSFDAPAERYAQGSSELLEPAPSLDVGVQETTQGVSVRPPGNVSISRRELLILTEQLSAALCAGVPVLDVLDDMGKDAESRSQERVVDDLRRRIAGGESLSAAMSRQPRVFAPFYVHSVAAGEAVGAVGEVLADIESFLEWQEELRSRVTEMSIYPLFVLAAVGALVAILLTFVFPSFFSSVLENGLPLSAPAKFLLDLGLAAQQWWLHSLVGGAVLLLFAVLLFRLPRSKFLVGRLQLRIPLIGSILRRLAISRFARYLAIMQRSGVGLPDGLEIAAAVVGNPFLVQSLLGVRERVLSGLRLSDALRHSGQFPALLVRMIRLGEQTGTMANMLQKVAKLCEREMEVRSRILLAVLGPIIIVVLGLIVLGLGYIVISTIYFTMGEVGAN